MKITVCDSVMGSGKTQAAIARMNMDREHNYLFVTQYLSECQRVARACPDRGFRQPSNVGKGKLTALNELLRGRHNIASTHALFYKYTDETLGLIRKGHYVLVLDEVLDVLDFIKVTRSDIDILFDTKLVRVESDTNRVVWMDEDYNGRFNDLRDRIETGCVTYEDSHFMVWKMPLEMFEAFDEVIILTYMFEAQYQALYYRMHGVNINYIGVQHIDGLHYEFIPGKAQGRIKLPVIHLCTNEKLNDVGSKDFSLSSTWQKNGGGAHTDGLEELRRDLANFFTNRCPRQHNLRLWACYSESKRRLQGGGYTKRFLSYNTRATNDYRECAYLAYVVNIFANVNAQRYFQNRGYAVDDDKVAISEMVQWLWRSRLRDGKEIWLYLPSKRMRRLLYQWVEEVTGSADCIVPWD